MGWASRSGGGGEDGIHGSRSCAFSRELTTTRTRDERSVHGLSVGGGGGGSSDTKDAGRERGERVGS